METALLAGLAAGLLLAVGLYGLRALAWLAGGALATAGYALSLLALAAWSVLNPGEAKRLWREAGRRHAAG